MTKSAINDLKFFINEAVKKAVRNVTDPELNGIWQQKNPIAVRNRELEKIVPVGFDEEEFAKLYHEPLNLTRRHTRTTLEMIRRIFEGEKGLYKVFELTLNKLFTAIAHSGLSTGDIENVMSGQQEKDKAEFKPRLSELYKNLQDLEPLVNDLLQDINQRKRHEPGTTGQKVGEKIEAKFRRLQKYFLETAKLIVAIP